MTGFIYVISSERGIVKIGYSKNPKRRFGSVQTGSDRCKLLGYVPGTREQEISIHRSLDSSRFHGEWYRPDPEVQVFIDRVAGHGIENKKSKRIRLSLPKGAHPISHFISASGHNRLSFANALGVAPSSVTRWINSGRKPELEMVARIEQVTNGAVRLRDLALHQVNS